MFLASCYLPPLPGIHRISFFLSLDVEDRKECTAASVYTRNPDHIHKCDGWSRVSFEECKRKCQRNELPVGCDQIKNPLNEKPVSGCAFAVWDDNSDWAPGWCQLADDSCVLSEKFTGKVWRNPNHGK